MNPIIVQRAPADFQGPDITDSLIVVPLQALRKGIAEINKTALSKVDVSGTVPLVPYMEPGKVALVTDLEIGQYKAVLKRCPLTIDRQQDGSFTATTSVVLQRNKK